MLMKRDTSPTHPILFANSYGMWNGVNIWSTIDRLVVFVSSQWFQMVRVHPQADPQTSYNSGISQHFLSLGANGLQSHSVARRSYDDSVSTNHQ